MQGSRWLTTPHAIANYLHGPLYYKNRVTSKSIRGSGSSGCVAAVSSPRLKVVYSHSKKHVPVAQLATLLENEWGEHVPVDRLKVAVVNSTAIVAAFVREGSLYQSVPGLDLKIKPDPSSLLLIGFARCSTDRAFAGTIHNLVVHPLARRQGIATKVLSRLIHQLALGGVTDIGMHAPNSVINFLLKASFEEDREKTTSMFFMRGNRPLGLIVP